MQAQQNYQRTPAQKMAEPVVSAAPQLSFLVEEKRSDSRRFLQESDRFNPNNGRALASFRRRRRCPCAPGSSPGKTPDDHHEVQKALL
jgi:hypothetical protein